MKKCMCCVFSSTLWSHVNRSLWFLRYLKGCTDMIVVPYIWASILNKLHNTNHSWYTTNYGLWRDNINYSCCCISTTLFKRRIRLSQKAIVMAVLKSMVLWVAFFLSCSSSGEAFHSDSQHVDAFENILKTMKLNNSLELETLTTLLKNLGLQDCADNTAHLHQVKLFDIFIWC